MKKTANPDPDENAPMAFNANMKLIKQRAIVILAELAKEYKSGLVDEQQRSEIISLIKRKVNEDNAPLTMMEKGILLQDVLDEVFGFGPLGPIMRDPTVQDIYVNSPAEIYVMREEQLIKTNVEFEDAGHLKQTIDKILVQLGLQFAEAHPVVDARLPNLARINITLTASGPALSIHFFRVRRISFTELVSEGMLSEAMFRFLQACLKAGINVLIAGGGKSGKTSLLCSLLNSTDKNERIITIESDPELDLNIHENRIQLLSSADSTATKKGAVSLADLVHAAKQMLPGRIVMGELGADGCAELFDLMQCDASGVASTLKAQSGMHALQRLELLLLQGNNRLSSEAAKRLIAESLQLVISVKRYEDGLRRVSEIAELAGVENDSIRLKSLFHFQEKARSGSGGAASGGQLEGEFVASGKLPGFHERFRELGVYFNPEWMF